MPRTRPSKTTANSTTTSSKSSNKRPRSDGPSTVTPGSRSSKRLRESATATPVNGKTTTKTTPKKSKYFAGSDGEDEEEAESTSGEDPESGYEDEDEEAHATEDSVDVDEDEEEEGYESEENVRSRKKSGGRKSTGSRTTGGTKRRLPGGADLLREGVSTGLGPGKQVFIEKPKPRGDGGVKYVPERIHPNTMAFLADLKANNDREWLKMHDPDYRQSWTDWTSFVEALTEKIAKTDPTIPELPSKDLVFRIYRDIRFSSDPTPYKPHFSAAWSRTGRKGPYACYYVQIQPGGNSFVGSGLWHPDAEPVALLRRDFDRHPDKIKRVLTEANLRKVIFGGIANDEKKAVKAFVASNSENALKTKPKGYDASHKDLELLRLRNFTIGKKLKDDELTDPKGLQKIIDLIEVMCPFVTYLNSVVMPDDDDDSSAGDDENEDEDGDEENES